MCVRALPSCVPSQSPFFHDAMFIMGFARMSHSILRVFSASWKGTDEIEISRECRRCRRQIAISANAFIALHCTLPSRPTSLRNGCPC